MIDGGVIANNPSIYAYQVARYFNDAVPNQDPKNLNIMSFAAGNSKFTPIKSADQFQKLKDLMYQGAGNMGTDIRLHNGYMKYFVLPEDNWLRLESMSSTSLFGVDKKSVQDLETNGHNLWNTEKDNIMKMVKKIMADRFTVKN